MVRHFELVEDALANIDEHIGLISEEIEKT